MRRLTTRRAIAGPILAALAALPGCCTTSSAEKPVATGVVSPAATTGPWAQPVEAPAPPGTAIVLPDGEFSYTPTGAAHPRPYRLLGPVLTVARGTLVELRLAPGSYARPTSSRPGTLSAVRLVWSTATAQAWFRAAAPGRSVLAARVRPCQGVELACRSDFRLAVRVTQGP